MYVVVVVKKTTNNKNRIIGVCEAYNGKISNKKCIYVKMGYPIVCFAHIYNKTFIFLFLLLQKTTIVIIFI